MNIWKTIIFPNNGSEKFAFDTLSMPSGYLYSWDCLGDTLWWREWNVHIIPGIEDLCLLFATRGGFCIYRYLATSVHHTFGNMIMRFRFVKIEKFCILNVLNPCWFQIPSININIILLIFPEITSVLQAFSVSIYWPFHRICARKILAIYFYKI